MFQMAIFALPVTRTYFQSNWHPGSDADGQCCRMHRYGNSGDGGKMVCDSDLSELADLPVLVSVGSANEFSFEEDMHRRYPQMQIHVFDGTVKSPKVPSFITYHDKNLNSQTASILSRFKKYILKIDCEGCEYDVFEHINTHRIMQILIEVHGDRYLRRGSSLARSNLANVKKLMGLLNTTHSVFYAEPNIQWTDGNCIEFSMRRRPSFEVTPPSQV